jgi:hypothetical protein
MQQEMDEERSLGLGLPVDVTNNIAQQQMMNMTQQERPPVPPQAPQQ